MLVCLCFGCKQDPLVPKPKGYFKLDFPDRGNYEQFQMAECDFVFNHPTYVIVEKDTLFFNEKPDDPCWLNVKYPMLNGVVHMSYKSLQQNELNQLTEDYHRMKNKHVIKADFIDDAVIRDGSKNLFGLVSQVGGDVASAHQFYITDSTNHFVRGSLYFRTPPNADSLKPAVLFVREDLVNMLESWQWK